MDIVLKPEGVDQRICKYQSHLEHICGKQSICKSIYSSAYAAKYDAFRAHVFWFE